MMEPNWQGQYDTAVQNTGLFRLRDWTTVRVTGADRAAFLHNMCTNDVKGLASGSGCEAFFTDVKGKIHTHGFLLADAEGIDIVTVQGRGPDLIAQLDRYIIREDVSLSDVTTARAWMLLFGSKAAEIVVKAFDVDVAKLDAPWRHQPTDAAGAGAAIVRCDLPWTGGFLIGCEAVDVPAIEQRVIEAGASMVDEPIWQCVRVESGWPLWGVDFDATNLPQEVSRDAQAISFRKGCYLGQETVARIDALGHVNKQLAIVQFAGDVVPSVGTELFQGEQTVGRVTSACWSPRVAKPQAMAMVKRGANAAGTSLSWTGGTGNVAAS